MVNPTHPVKTCQPLPVAWSLAIVPEGDPLNSCRYAGRAWHLDFRAHLARFTWPRHCPACQVVIRRRGRPVVWQSDLAKQATCDVCKGRGHV